MVSEPVPVFEWCHHRPHESEVRILLWVTSPTTVPYLEDNA